ncbi:U8-agatoxin-Ao1a-like [Panonychus citri]|uniref:U8-agatoxin-Ao1a-like n=1 Tax=Panonychus citri TaxID=50023 RepID=UPI0023080D6E|nr:U8-agatoxin-Ao1a-like [Panonychus citri]
MEDLNLSLTEPFSSQLTNNHDNRSPIAGKSLRPIKFHFAFSILVIIVVLSTFFNVKSSSSGIYSTSDRQVTSEMMEDYGDGGLVRLILTKKHTCIRRGAICDLRPNDCCGSSLCKCNLWGTNCRCQRMGLFQRWGRK